MLTPVLTVASALLLLPGAAAAQAPTPGPPVTVDGPSPAIVSLGGMAVARDGTGGLVYLKQVAGVPHVFVSRVIGGVFQAPEQVDAGLAGPASQPVIGAANGGLLVIAFISGGGLYVVDRMATLSAYTQPALLAAGSSNPALQVTTLGKAYLAFTATGAGGHDVRCAYFVGGQWALEVPPLDAVATDDAGSGSGRPQVAAAGDGVGIVVWGESGHVYSRRIWRTSPSPVYEQADVPSLAGWTEVSADQPVVGSGGDSSYAAVAFREVFSNGSQQQSRVLMRRLRASQYDGVTRADGLNTPGPEGATQPQVAVGEYGRGFVTSAGDSSNQLSASVLSGNEVNTGVVRVGSLPNATPPYGVAGIAGLSSELIAWQHDPGSGGSPEIRVRYAPDGSVLGPEFVVSAPIQGPTDAADGLAAAGDIGGDAAIAWVQGDPDDMQIVVAQLYQPPGSVTALGPAKYVRSSQPVVSWSPAAGRWGPLRYHVTVDGVPVGQTTATSLRIPTPLSDGPHRWQVTAINPAGLSSTARTAIFWVDTIAPKVSFTLTGAPRAGSVLHLSASITDAPPPLPPADASGIASATVSWGDGSHSSITRTKSHVYSRPGRYKLAIVVRDRAGNVTTVTRFLRITSKPPNGAPSPSKPKHKP